jgi:glycosyltransferase involved in cell wall biosynthesis
VDERFQPGPKPEYLLKRYGLVGKKILLTVSRLSSKDRYKGQDRVIDVLPRLRQRHPDLIYVIAGEGDERPRLEKMAREKGLDGAVRFIGSVKESELVDTYRMADLFVMPSTGEGFGIVFLEAARCGIPVVGGNRDGTCDALREGEIGRLVEPENPDELARAILESLASQKSRREDSKYFSHRIFFQVAHSLVEEIAGRTGC